MHNRPNTESEMKLAKAVSKFQKPTDDWGKQCKLGRKAAIAAVIVAHETDNQGVIPQTIDSLPPVLANGDPDGIRVGFMTTLSDLAVMGWRS